MLRIKNSFTLILFSLIFMIQNSYSQEGKIFLAPRFGINNFYGDLSENHDFGWNLGFTGGYFINNFSEFEFEFSYNPFPEYKFQVTTPQNPVGTDAIHDFNDIHFGLAANFYFLNPVESFTPYVGVEAGLNIVWETMEIEKDNEYTTYDNNYLYNISPQIGLSIPLQNGGKIDIRAKFIFPLTNSDAQDKVFYMVPFYHFDAYKYWTITYGYTFTLN